MTLISIILPVYNEEKLLSRCVESIIGQTFQSFELIIINDGSNDNTAAICDCYAKADKRIKVFHKANGGVSSARQVGIENAKGNYSIHVDADDYVKPNYLELLYKETLRSQADVTICDYFFEKRKAKVIYRDQSIDSSDSLDFLKQIYNGEKVGVLWNKLIRHAVYKELNISFPVDIFYCEDVFVLTKMFLNDLKMAHVKQGLYHHCYNKRSITKSVSRKQIANRQLFIQRIEDLYGINTFDMVQKKQKLSLT